MRPIYQIIVHCSDSDFGNAALINEWHKERGFNRQGTHELQHIGYHAVILNGRTHNSIEYFPKLDGRIQPGRLVHEVGAHVYGHNSNSLGICLVGVSHFTGAQYNSLAALLKVWKALYGDNLFFKIVGHTELDPKKTCPNFDVQEWLRTYEI